MSERFYERRHVLGVNGLLSLLVDGYRAKRNLEKKKGSITQASSYRARSKLLENSIRHLDKLETTNDTEYRYPLR